MEICPVCHNFMTFNMKYCYGQPYIYYMCSCGYSTEDIRTVATTSTSDNELVLNMTENVV